MKDLIAILPDIAIYLATGFVFVYIFRLTFNNCKANDTLTLSLIIGYFITSVLRLIPFTINSVVDNACIIFTGGVAGYLMAKMFDSLWFQKITEKIGIMNTTHPYFWDDLTDSSGAQKVEIVIDDNTYSGFLRFIEERTNNPKIALYDCVVNGDRSEVNSIVVLDTSKAQSIKIMYHPDSDMIGYIKAGW